MELLNIKKWQTDKDIKFIFNILDKKNEETRFIGGCLRNLILKKKTDDIDIATTILPNKVLQLLKKKNIKTITSGISHGTVIAIINKKKIEITTLRKDIKTDGRHAKVKFTKDWFIDSNRRDLTINALSCNLNGKLYDYHDGIKDLKEGNIKFIGNTEERIKEDFLRILRYFRFYGLYGKKKIDKNDIKVFKKLSSNLKKLSPERIYSEFKKILLCNNLYEVLSLMKKSKLLKYIIVEDNDLKRVKNLKKICKPTQLIDFSTLLSILIKEKNLLKVFNNMNLSNSEKEKIKNIITFRKKINFKLIANNLIKFVYMYGKELCFSLLIYDYVISPNQSKKKTYLKFFLFINSYKIPKFPIFGKDIINRGVKTGPVVGKILKSIEEWWIDNKTKPSRKDCLKKIKEFC